MSDADRAYQIAKERIARAKQSRLFGLRGPATTLNLSPHFTEKGDFELDAEPRLAALDRLPPEIEALTGLTRLFLDGTQVADLAPLARMEAMQELDLSDTQVADLAPLARMEAMRVLYLNGTQVADLAPLARMEAMRALRLSDTQVADLAPLARMEAIRELYLSNTQVADLAPLARMEAMRVLYLRGTRADLSGLVAPGAAWEVEDRALAVVGFKDVPVEDAALAEIGARSYGGDVGKEMLARLRELRDAPPVPPALEAPAPERPAEAQVFLSYSREDHARAADLRAALAADGVSIWQDIDMMVGRRFRDEIDQRIDGAAAAVVLWSASSIASDYVVSEAERARAADKLVPALIEAVGPPRPFDVLNAADLTGWAGDRADAEYQKLLWSLRAHLTPDAPVGAALDDGAAIAPEQQPVGAARRNENAAERARALRAQIALARLLRGEAAHANVHQRLCPRLDAYIAEMEAEDPLWESVDGLFGSIAPLLREEELDVGLIDTAGRLRAGHAALAPYLDKVKDVEAAEPDWPELDAEDAAEAGRIVEVAANALAAAPFGAAAPEFLRTKQGIFATEAEEALYDADPASAARRSSWLGRTAYVSLGFISAVGSLASTLAYAATPSGRIMMAQLGEAWAALMRLVGLA